MKSLSRLRAKAKEIALECYINPKEEFLDKVEEELEKSITPEFVEKIRSDLVKKSKTTRPEIKESKETKEAKDQKDQKDQKELFTEQPPKKRLEP
jgi:hypothetical protein